MKITKQEIDAQIEVLKDLISINAPKENIKSEQLKLNTMLKEYLEENN